MAIIDDKVVAMSFENSKFQSGVGQTLSSLDKLKAALHFPGASKGLDQLNASSKKVDLSHIGAGVEAIQSKLSALRLMAIAVFAQLAAGAVRAGASFVKAFTIGPAKAGFQEYTTNLNAVQTILANTQASGAGLKEVNAALDELNTYSDKTIYNFSQMAKNIGTFTAAGVDLKTATASIKGIANLAALSGSNSEQASTAMYQLSQAIASGSVKLMDWNSVVNAGMGGTVFQRALAMTAEKMGTLKKGTVELVGPMKNVKIAGESFRNSLSAPGKDGWLTSKVLTETLQMLTSDLTDAELRAKGWNEEQIKAIQQQAKTAMLAATTVKTLTGVIDVARETAGSGWAKTWQIIFGDFEEAKVLFTRVSNAVNSVLIDSARARNNVLGEWKELGGRDLLISSLAQAFKNLGMIIAPIKEAFRDIFPAKTGSDLMYLTQQFSDFTARLKPSATTVENLKRTFAGLFSIFSIGFSIIGEIIGLFFNLVGATSAGSGGFLSFTANIGDSLVAFRKWLIEGGRLAAFFDRLGAILRAPIDLLRAIATAVSDLFSGFSPGGFFGQVDGIGKKLSPLQAIMEGIANVWAKFLDVVSGSGKVMRPAIDSIVSAIQGIGPAISGAVSGMNFEAILAVIRTGFLGALVVMFKQFLGKGSILNQLMGRGGILGNIRGTFSALEGSMQSLSTNLKAKTLKEIALAIALLAVAVVALSLVDPEKLKSSLTAITVMFGQLLAAMAILTAVTKTTGFIKLPFITGSLILLAGAIDVLALAVIALSLLSWEDLLKGLGAVGALLVGISLAVVPLSANSSGMIRASIGIAAIGVSLLLIATAVRIMGTMDLQALGKGLGGIAAGLVLMVFAMQNMPIVPLRSTIGLVAMAGALILLATAVRIMGSMDLRSLGKGLGGMAAGLILMVFALNSMPAKSMLRNSIGLIAMAGAMNLIATAILKMGGMSIKQLATGLIALGGALAIMAGALYLMSGAVPGAIALGIAATGIALLAPALVTLGKQSWGTILKGMVALGLALGALAIAAALIAPSLPAIAGLGVALLLVGGGLALAGAGIFLIGAGLSALVVAAPTGVGILIAAFVELTKGVIDNVKLLVLGLLEIVRALAATAPKFVDAGLKILDALIEGIIKALPRLEVLFNALLTTMLNILNTNQSRLIQAGIGLLQALLTGIKNNIPKLITTVVDIVVKFLNTLSNNLGRIITAGTNLLIAFVKGIANQYLLVITAATTIITKFLTTIANNLSKFVTAGLSILVKFLQGIANNIGRVIKAGTDIIVAFITGIGNASRRVVAAAVTAITKFIHAISQGAVKLVDEGAKAIVNFLNGVAAAINAHSGEMRAAGARIGFAIADGMSFGLLSRGRALASKAASIASSALGAMKRAVGAESPSKEAFEIGKFVVAGFANGLSESGSALTSAKNVGNSVITMFKNVFQITSPSKVMYNIGKAVGEGFAQGIRGSTDDIKNAFTELNAKLLDEMRTARETIATEQDRLAELLKEKQEKIKEINSETFKKEGEKAKKLAAVQKQYAEPIAEAQKAIAENQLLLKKSTTLHTILIKSLKDEKKELLALAVEFDKVTEKLKEAEAALEEATRTRDEALKGFESQYSDLPSLSGPMTEEIASAREAILVEKAKLAEVLKAKVVDPKAVEAANAAIVEAQAKFDKLIEGKVLTSEGTEVDPLATYLQALETQAKAVGVYGATLEQLRQLGLDDATYQKLLKEGTADQSFANQLLAGGKTAVQGLNKLDAQLATVSKKLATQAAKNLYQAGVDAAQGLVDGLKSKKDTLRKEMESIAREMLAALRKVLKARSPSEEFATIGSFAMEGLALGFTRSTKVVTKAIEDSAQDALSAMKNSMRRISDAVTEELNSNPVITPILDLTQVRSQSQELAAITAGASLGQAAIISAAQIAAEAEAVTVAPGGTSITYEQNNYSPTALTEIEIYRQTRNQLSQLRSVLAT